MSGSRQETLRDLRPLAGPRLLLMAHAHAENSGERALSAAGRLQSARAASNLARRVQAPKAIVSSPLLRASETANIVSRGLSSEPLPIRVESRLDLGLYDGPEELMRLTAELEQCSEPLMVITCALEVELIACGLLGRVPGRKRIPTEATLPRGLNPASVVALSRLDGHWRIASVFDGAALG